MKFLRLACIALSLIPTLAYAQLPGGGGALSIGQTPITNGTSGNCLVITGTTLGQVACGGPAAITIGTSTVTGGTNGRILFNNAGVVGELVGSTAVNGTACALGGACTTTAAAGTLTGNTLNPTVTGSSLTSVGTLTGGATGAGFTVALATSTLTGAIPPANVVGSYTGITGTGTLTAGATGAGFTVGLGTSTITGTLPSANVSGIYSGITGTGVLTSGSTGAGFTLALSSSTISGALSSANLAYAVSSTTTTTAVCNAGSFTGGSTITWRYWLTGKLVIFTGSFNPTYASCTNFIFTPIPIGNPTGQIWIVNGYNGSQGFSLIVNAQGGNMSIFKYDGTFPGLSGSLMTITGFYEVT